MNAKSGETHLSTLASTHSVSQSVGSSCKLMAITWLHSSVSQLGVQPSAKKRKKIVATNTTKDGRGQNKKKQKNKVSRPYRQGYTGTHCLLWVFDYNDEMMMMQPAHAPPTFSTAT